MHKTRGNQKVLKHWVGGGTPQGLLRNSDLDFWAYILSFWLLEHHLITTFSLSDSSGQRTVLGGKQLPGFRAGELNNNLHGA